MIRRPRNSTLFPYPTLFGSLPVFTCIVPRPLESGAVKLPVNDVVEKAPPLFVSRVPAVKLPIPSAAKLPARDKYLNAPELSTPDRKSTRLNSSHDQISYAVF